MDTHEAESRKSKDRFCFGAAEEPGGKTMVLLGTLNS